MTRPSSMQATYVTTETCFFQRGVYATQEHDTHTMPIHVGVHICDCLSKNPPIVHTWQYFEKCQFIENSI